MELPSISVFGGGELPADPGTKIYFSFVINLVELLGTGAMLVGGSSCLGLSPKVRGVANWNRGSASF